MAVVPLIVVWKYKYLQTPKTKALTDKVSKAQLQGQEPFHLRVFHWQSLNSPGSRALHLMLMESQWNHWNLSLYVSKEEREQSTNMEDRFSQEDTVS